jgi:hypothetical protein
MEDKSSQLESLFERTQEYVKTTFDLLKFKILERAAQVVSSIISSLILTLFIFLFLFILSIGVSFWLGEMLDGMYYGFFIVAGFYAILGIIFYFIIFNHIKKRMSNYIVKNVL